MPLLEDWFNLVAICLGAICLDEPAKMNMAKTAEYRFDIVGDLAILGSCPGDVAWSVTASCSSTAAGQTDKKRKKKDKGGRR